MIMYIIEGTQPYNDIAILIFKLTNYSLETLSSSISSLGGCSGIITPPSERVGGSSNIPTSLLLRSLSSEIETQKSGLETHPV